MMSNNKKSNVIWTILIFVFALIFIIASVYFIYNYAFVGRDEVPSGGYSSVITESLPEEILPDNPVDFATLKEQNSDIIGWIRVDGLDVINYPIVQSHNDPEDFYINHNIERKQSKAGSIYIQKYNNPDFTDPNTIIYGHNMANGTMFGSLGKFRKADFFNEHKQFHVYVPGHIYDYTIVSGFVYDNRHILNSFNFQTEEGYQGFINDVLNPPSLVKNVREGVTVTTDSKLVTLSTCVGNDTQRYVIIGVLTGDTKTK